MLQSFDLPGLLGDAAYLLAYTFYLFRVAGIQQPDILVGRRSDFRASFAPVVSRKSDRVVGCQLNGRPCRDRIFQLSLTFCSSC